MTARKKHRNIVYVLCGIAILASMLLIALFDLVFKVDHLIGPLAPTFCFETTALFAFGVAWMVKGELVLGDPEPERTKSITTDRLPTPI